MTSSRPPLRHLHVWLFVRARSVVDARGFRQPGSAPAPEIQCRVKPATEPWSSRRRCSRSAPRTGTTLIRTAPVRQAPLLGAPTQPMTWLSSSTHALAFQREIRRILTLWYIRSVRHHVTYKRHIQFFLFDRSPLHKITTRALTSYRARLPTAKMSVLMGLQNAHSFSPPIVRAANDPTGTL